MNERQIATYSIESMLQEKRMQLVAAIKDQQMFEPQVLENFDKSRHVEGNYEILPADPLLMKQAKSIINLLLDIEKLSTNVLTTLADTVQAETTVDTIFASMRLASSAYADQAYISRLNANIDTLLVYYQELMECLQSLPLVGNTSIPFLEELQRIMEKDIKPFIQQEIQKLQTAPEKNLAVALVQEFVEPPELAPPKDTLKKIHDVLENAKLKLAEIIKGRVKNVELDKNGLYKEISAEHPPYQRMLLKTANALNHFESSFEEVMKMATAKGYWDLLVNSKFVKTFVELGNAVKQLLEMDPNVLKQAGFEELTHAIKTCLEKIEPVMIELARQIDAVESQLGVRDDTLQNQFDKVYKNYTALAGALDIQLRKKPPFWEERLSSRQALLANKEEHLKELKKIRKECEENKLTFDSPLHQLLNAKDNLIKVGVAHNYVYLMALNQFIEQKSGLKELNEDILSLKDKIYELATNNKKDQVQVHYLKLIELSKLKKELEQKMVAAKDKKQPQNFSYQRDGPEGSARIVPHSNSIKFPDELQLTRQAAVLVSIDRQIESTQEERRRLEKRVKQAAEQVKPIEQAVENVQIEDAKRSPKAKEKDPTQLAVKAAEQPDFQQINAELTIERQDEFVKKLIAERSDPFYQAKYINTSTPLNALKAVSIVLDMTRKKILAELTPPSSIASYIDEGDLKKFHESKNNTGTYVIKADDSLVLKNMKAALNVLHSLEAITAMSWDYLNNYYKSGTLGQGMIGLQAVTFIPTALRTLKDSMAHFQYYFGQLCDYAKTVPVGEFQTIPLLSKLQEWLVPSLNFCTSNLSNFMKIDFVKNIKDFLTQINEMAQKVPEKPFLTLSMLTQLADGIDDFIIKKWGKDEKENKEIAKGQDEKIKNKASAEPSSSLFAKATSLLKSKSHQEKKKKELSPDKQKKRKQIKAIAGSNKTAENLRIVAKTLRRLQSTLKKAVSASNAYIPSMDLGHALTDLYKLYDYISRMDAGDLTLLKETFKLNETFQKLQPLLIYAVTWSEQAEQRLGLKRLTAEQQNAEEKKLEVSDQKGKSSEIAAVKGLKKQHLGLKHGVMSHTIDQACRVFSNLSEKLEIPLGQHYPYISLRMGEYQIMRNDNCLVLENLVKLKTLMSRKALSESPLEARSLKDLIWLRTEVAALSPSATKMVVNIDDVIAKKSGLDILEREIKTEEDKIIQNEARIRTLNDTLEQLQIELAEKRQEKDPDNIDKKIMSQLGEEIQRKTKEKNDLIKQNNACHNDIQTKLGWCQDLHDQLVSIRTSEESYRYSPNDAPPIIKGAVYDVSRTFLPAETYDSFLMAVNEQEVTLRNSMQFYTDQIVTMGVNSVDSLIETYQAKLDDLKKLCGQLAAEKEFKVEELINSKPMLSLFAKIDEIRKVVLAEDASHTQQQRNLRELQQSIKSVKTPVSFMEMSLPAMNELKAKLVGIPKAENYISIITKMISAKENENLLKENVKILDQLKIKIQNGEFKEGDVETLASLMNKDKNVVKQWLEDYKNQLEIQKKGKFIPRLLNSVTSFITADIFSQIEARKDILTVEANKLARIENISEEQYHTAALQAIIGITELQSERSVRHHESVQTKLTELDPRMQPSHLLQEMIKGNKSLGDKLLPTIQMMEKHDVLVHEPEEEKQKSVLAQKDEATKSKTLASTPGIYIKLDSSRSKAPKVFDFKEKEAPSSPVPAGAGKEKAQSPKILASRRGMILATRKSPVGQRSSPSPKSDNITEQKNVASGESPKTGQDSISPTSRSPIRNGS